MIIFWIFAVLVALTSGIFAYSILQLGLLWSVVYGLVALIFVRGIFTYVRRWLILSERLGDIQNADERTLEVNRYIFWRRILGLAILVAIYFGGASLVFGIPPADALFALPGLAVNALTTVGYFLILMLAQFAIFFGPFLLFGMMGRQTIQPGDANYDVKMEDVRGQKSPVNEMRRILKLMESGRNYVRAGGKRERGVLFVGPPGTGKTMLAKGIASSLQMPIITTSGASFQGMFLGMDMVAVFMMVRAAKKKAKRWGGCAIFIDEFDALGTRRQGMGGAGGGGGMGAMFGGGQLGLNTLLVLMDGVDNPTLVKRLFRRFINVSLDGLFVPREIRINGAGLSLRVPRLRAPRYNLFFMGATNRPSVLDEAVTRPGRFGRTVTFRMPTREDRKDIADLYFTKKAHDPDLDSPARRDEFARVTEGYSPAMLEQSLSLALMYAFEDGRDHFNWRDLREAMGNIEAGLAEPVEYSERDKLGVARHELGHAVAARFYLPEQASVRLSVRMRSGSLGHHRAVDKEERFTRFRTEEAGNLRHTLGAIASERVFYNENSSGVSMDLVQATSLACHMIGVWGMGPDPLDPILSIRATRMGQQLISRAQSLSGVLEPGTLEGAVLSNPDSRKMVAQVMGAAFIDCWRLMYVNQEGIDQAAEALMAQGELIGDEITGLLDSVNLRLPGEPDPFPQDFPEIPDLEAGRGLHVAGA